MRVREEIHGATEAQRYREVGPVGYRLLVHHAHSLLTPAPIKGAEQSHPAMLLPFSPLSFPRKRESSAPKPVTRPWIPACAGMTATERSENPNAIALHQGKTAQRPTSRCRCSGYRAPCTVILETARSMSRRSSVVSSIPAAAMF